MDTVARSLFIYLFYIQNIQQKHTHTHIYIHCALGSRIHIPEMFAFMKNNLIEKILLHKETCSCFFNHPTLSFNHRFEQIRKFHCEFSGEPSFFCCCVCLHSKIDERKQMLPSNAGLVSYLQNIWFSFFLFFPISFIICKKMSNFVSWKLTGKSSEDSKGNLIQIQKYDQIFTWFAWKLLQFHSWLFSYLGIRVEVCPFQFGHAPLRWK